MRSGCFYLDCRTHDRLGFPSLRSLEIEDLRLNWCQICSYRKHTIS
ncbi:hypothetical protein KP509_1Z052800 [Ceratopteris richardii]|nr:hypothetical protein KP509_1Z052800 [Ceratopteris richardii]